MKYRIHVARTATQDLNRTTSYIMNQLKNPVAARSLLKSAIACIDSLECFPARYPVIDEPILSAQHLRFIPVHGYLLFYKIDDSAQIVHVLRFLYGKSNWVSILKADFIAD